MNKNIILITLASALFACKVQNKVKNHHTVTPFSLQNKTVYAFTTADKTNLRLSESKPGAFSEAKQPLETELCVFVNPSQTFQTLVGIGGALTDASAEIFAKLPKETQDEFLTAYYDPQKGIGYTFARTNINSCDFSSSSYTYVADNDVALNSFSLAHDEQFKMPFIKKVMVATGNNLQLYVSPWSPPAWMKDNNSMLQGGRLLPEYRQAWANYYVKFIKGYEAAGIPVWGLTVQNEPMAKQRWESCIYTAGEERDFIKLYLGPTLKKQGLQHKRLIAWDHNRDLIYQRAETILNDKKAAKYIWGIGYHWYETWTKSDMLFNNLRQVAESFPDKKLIFTEGTIENFEYEKLNDWALGEKYGYSLINDFNSGTVAWTDWNVLLNEKGGPNHVKNFCFAPIHANTQTGKLIYTNIYYYLGHFSKFIRPGAKRVISSSNRDKLETTAFLNTDGSLTVVVLNRSNNELPFKLIIKGQSIAAISLAHSINTYLIK